MDADLNTLVTALYVQVDDLLKANPEQAYRERNGIEVADDPAVLEREQAERAAAQQAQQQVQREQMDHAARMDEAMAAIQVEGFGMG